MLYKITAIFILRFTKRNELVSLRWKLQTAFLFLRFTTNKSLTQFFWGAEKHNLNDLKNFVWKKWVSWAWKNKICLRSPKVIELFYFSEANIIFSKSFSVLIFGCFSIKRKALIIYYLQLACCKQVRDESPLKLSHCLLL